MGRQLPVRCRCETCSNTIYNAVPLSLHQFAGRGLFARVSALLCMFTTEDAAETEQITDFFGGLRGQAGSLTGVTGGGPGLKDTLVTGGGSGLKDTGVTGGPGLKETGRDRGESGRRTAGPSDSQKQGKTNKKKDKNKNRNKNKSRQARTGVLPQALPFTEFTNGHFRTGAL